MPWETCPDDVVEMVERVRQVLGRTCSRASDGAKTGSSVRDELT